MVLKDLSDALDIICSDYYSTFARQADLESRSVNCLVRSGSCGYLGDAPKVPAAPVPVLPMWHLLGPQQSHNTCSGAAAGYKMRSLSWSSPTQVAALSMFDPFGSLPMHNSRRNSELFHFCESCQQHVFLTTILTSKFRSRQRIPQHGVCHW